MNLNPFVCSVLAAAALAAPIVSAAEPQRIDESVAASHAALDTAFHEAVLKCFRSYRYDDSAMRELLRQGADVNARDAQGLTPLLALPYVHNLRIPQQHSCAPIIRLLAEAGADLNACDKDGYTRIKLMLRHGDLSPADRECVKLLQQLGCSPRPDIEKSRFFK
ncbi:MAG: hypothetical protein IJB64_04675 [Akkermansia sp.]|nr:hypothetical protein [Akkermansia sp.]